MIDGESQGRHKGCSMTETVALNVLKTNDVEVFDLKFKIKFKIKIIEAILRRTVCFRTLCLIVSKSSCGYLEIMIWRYLYFVQYVLAFMVVSNDFNNDNIFFQIILNIYTYYR